MIHGVRFRNFKALRDVELELSRFTVLVGPNASGKTSVLEGLHLLTRLAATDPRDVFVDRASLGVLASRGAEGVLELGLSGSFRAKRGDLSITFPAIEDFPFTDVYRFESRWGDRRFAVRRQLSPIDDESPDTHPGGELGLGLVLRDAGYLRFDLACLAEPAYSDLPTPVMDANGRGLAAVLADMAVARPDDFARLQEALRAVIPGVSRVRLARAQIPRAGAAGVEEPVWGHAIVFDMAGAPDIPASEAGEGALLALGLFAALLSPDRRELVLVDRLERGVSPASLGELYAQIDAILEEDPELQVIATTDSPLLLDHHAAEAILVHCLLEDGSVRVKALKDHPEYPLHPDLRPGELWTQVGEAWVARDRAVPPALPVVPVDAEVIAVEAQAFPASMPPLPRA